MSLMKKNSLIRENVENRESCHTWRNYLIIKQTFMLTIVLFPITSLVLYKEKQTCVKGSHDDVHCLPYYLSYNTLRSGDFKHKFLQLMPSHSKHTTCRTEIKL